jgi:hypothetical protein
MPNSDVRKEFFANLLENSVVPLIFLPGFYLKGIFFFSPRSIPDGNLQDMPVLKESKHAFWNWHVIIRKKLNRFCPDIRKKIKNFARQFS